MVVRADATPELLWQGRLHPWTPSGYEPGTTTARPSTEVQVLTPRSTVRALERGFAISTAL